MRKPIIGVMGPGNKATKQDLENAFELGKMIAQNGWILLSGGRNAGVMDEVSKGSKSAGGTAVGIIPTKDRDSVSEGVDIAIITNMGSARNYINILSSDVLIVCGMSEGTASEASMALLENIDVIFLTDMEEAHVFFKKLNPPHVFIVKTPDEAISQVKQLLG